MRAVCNLLSTDAAISSPTTSGLLRLLFLIYSFPDMLCSYYGVLLLTFTAAAAAR